MAVKDVCDLQPRGAHRRRAKLRVSASPQASAMKRSDGQRHNSRALGRVVNDDRADWRDAWALFPGDVAYIWHGGVHAGVVQTSRRRRSQLRRGRRPAVGVGRGLRL